MPSGDSEARAAFYFAAAAAAVLFLFRRPSKNFTWEELTTTNTGLPNKPNVEERVRLILLARQVLQPLRERFGPLGITSGFRSKDVNAALPNSSKTSLHMAGSAADLYSMEGHTAEQMAAWLYTQTSIPLEEVIVEPSWLHVARATSGPGARRFYISADGRNLVRWTPPAPLMVT